MNLGISFSLGTLTLTTFFDADWVGDPTDRRFTTSLLVFLGPSSISWLAKKQNTVSRSSIKAEYRALDTTAVELNWLRILFKELRIFLSRVLVIWCYNVSVIALSANPVFHSRTKHIEVDFHYVREKVLRRDLSVGFVLGKDNLADVFTKPLPAPLFLLQRHKLLVDSSPCHLRGDVEDDDSEMNSKKKKKGQNDRALKQR